MVGRPMSMPGAPAPAPPLPMGVVITAEMIYGLALSTRDEVIKLTEKISDVTDHEQRLRHLERWQWRVAGAAAAVGALVGGGAAALAAVAGVGP